MIVSAAILHKVVCVSYVMNKAGICGKSIDYIMGQPFLFFTGKESANMAVLSGVQICIKLVLLFVNIERKTKGSMQVEIVVPLFMFPCQLVSFAWCCFARAVKGSPF